MSIIERMFHLLVVPANNNPDRSEFLELKLKIICSAELTEKIDITLLLSLDHDSDCRQLSKREELGSTWPCGHAANCDRENRKRRGEGDAWTRSSRSTEKAGF
jgi:hypothetical protein